MQHIGKQTLERALSQCQPRCGMLEKTRERVFPQCQPKCNDVGTLDASNVPQCPPAHPQSPLESSQCQPNGLTLVDIWVDIGGYLG